MVNPDPHIACAKRCEQQIRAIVRDELAAAFPSLGNYAAERLDLAVRMSAHDDLRAALGLPPLTSDGGPQ